MLKVKTITTFIILLMFLSLGLSSSQFSQTKTFDIFPFQFKDGTDSGFKEDFRKLIETCEKESKTFRDLIGIIHDSSRPITVVENKSLFVGSPFAGFGNFHPELNLDLNNLSIYLSGDQLSDSLQKNLIGHLPPYTPRCAVIAHEIKEVFEYRKKTGATLPSQSEAREYKLSAHKSGVHTENRVAFDYGHRQHWDGSSLKRVGHCTPPGRIHVIIRNQIIWTEEIQLDANNPINYRLIPDDGNCHHTLTGEPINRWQSEN